MFDEVGELCWESMTLEEIGGVIAKTSSEDVESVAKRKFHRMEKQYLRELSQKTMTWQRAEEIRCMAERAKYSRCVCELELERRAEQRRDWLRLDEKTITEEEVEQIWIRAFWRSKLNTKAEKVWRRLHIKKLDQERPVEKVEDIILGTHEGSGFDQKTTIARRRDDESCHGFVIQVPHSHHYMCDHEY